MLGGVAQEPSPFQLGFGALSTDRTPRLRAKLHLRPRGSRDYSGCSLLVNCSTREDADCLDA